MVGARRISFDSWFTRSSSSKCDSTILFASLTGGSPIRSASGCFNNSSFVRTRSLTAPSLVGLNDICLFVKIAQSIDDERLGFRRSLFPCRTNHRSHCSVKAILRIVVLSRTFLAARERTLQQSLTYFISAARHIISDVRSSSCEHRNPWSWKADWPLATFVAAWFKQTKLSRSTWHYYLCLSDQLSNAIYCCFVVKEACCGKLFHQ